MKNIVYDFIAGVIFRVLNWINPDELMYGANTDPTKAPGEQGEFL